MIVAESVVKLSLMKDKLESSKSEDRGVCEKDHKEDDDGNGNSKNSGNGKPRVEKKKPNRKRDKLKCILYDDSHMLKLRKCSNKSIVERDDRAENEPKNLGSSKGKLRNYPKQSKSVVVKEKAISEFVESSKGLPHEENMSLSSNLGEKVMMKIVKLRPIRLNLSKTTELAESSVRLSLMEEVSLTLDLEEKVAMQTLKLGSIRLISVDTSEELPPLGECHSKGTTRALQEWVGENVTGRSSKPMTIAPNVSNGGLLFRWGSFGPQELARFGKLLEKPVRLKPKWPNDEDMTT
ncbi:hypothetical protein PVK06_010774 [Gossypium arboreum]|uniref:Uncharacterized protein n=1 Tax=Gossypium arboreum TaxID=29729 RepID=A0ABR0Q6Y5_GOSAR|nr:hypothetical protein PVK06_010774 [Gossypium arboreum]